MGGDVVVSNIRGTVGEGAVECPSSGVGNCRREEAVCEGFWWVRCAPFAEVVLLVEFRMCMVCGTLDGDARCECGVSVVRCVRLLVEDICEEVGGERCGGGSELECGKDGGKVFVIVVGVCRLFKMGRVMGERCIDVFLMWRCNAKGMIGECECLEDS